MCCAALDPEGSRTERLESLISETMPMQDLKIPDKILIPWKDAKLKGICS